MLCTEQDSGTGGDAYCTVVDDSGVADNSNTRGFIPAIRKAQGRLIVIIPFHDANNDCTD